MNQFEQHIQSGQDLYDWFSIANKRRNTIQNWCNGIYVSTAVRNTVLLSVDAGKITLDGKVYQIEFHNMHGGIWQAHISIEEK